MNEEQLLNRILEITALTTEEVSDITFVGSRYFGQYNIESDIDIIIWVNGDQLVSLNLGNFGGFLSNEEKIPINIRFMHLSKFNEPFMGKYILPKKSLITGIEYNKEVNDVEQYLLDFNKIEVNNIINNS